MSIVHHYNGNNIYFAQKVRAISHYDVLDHSCQHVNILFNTLAYVEERIKKSTLCLLDVYILNC